VADATSFRAKLATFPPDTADGSETPLTKLPKARSYLNRGKKQQQSSATDKSVLPLPEPRRIRDREHVRYVAQQNAKRLDVAPTLFSLDPKSFARW
jgi:hypothetical protein